MAKLGMIGAGSWGTALSVVLEKNGHTVTMWSAISAEIKMLRNYHEHVEKLPGVKLPDSIQYTTDLAQAVTGLSLIHI